MPLENIYRKSFSETNMRFLWGQLTTYFISLKTRLSISIALEFPKFGKDVLKLNSSLVYDSSL